MYECNCIYAKIWCGTKIELKLKRRIENIKLIEMTDLLLSVEG